MRTGLKNQRAWRALSPWVKFICDANGGLGTLRRRSGQVARPTGEIRGRARSRVGRDAVLRNPDRAVWTDLRLANELRIRLGMVRNSAPYTTASEGLKSKVSIPLEEPANTLKRGHRTLEFFEIPHVRCPAFRLRRWVAGFFQRNQVSGLKSFRAFTLIELMAVIVVICILIGALIGVAKYANRQIGVTRAKTQMAALQMALDAYKADVGYYPASTWVRCSGNFYAEQSNSACLYRALTRPKCYYRARQADIGAANGLTFFKDPWGTQWNYYRPALPQPISLVICNVNGGGIGYAWGGQHNPLTYDLYSYGPDKITSILGATMAGFALTKRAPAATPTTL